VKEAVDDSLSARSASLLASANFQLDFANKADFLKYLRNTIRPQLQELRNHGLVENLPGTTSEGMLWRWKTTLPSLADLALQAALTDGHT
jgi:hypothetical protein